MRHNRKINHLSRTNTHREAMLSNMASSLIKEKRIFTTIAKARELRKFIEPLITKSRTDTTHSRRTVFKNLRDKYAVKELFLDVSQKIGDRPGGYTRIIKTGNRLGDNAAMCMIELVDYNELLVKDKTPAKAAKTRRSRRKGGVDAVEVNATSAAPKTEIETVAVPEVVETATPVEEATVVEEIPAAVVEETPQVVAEETVPETETKKSAEEDNAE
ncbi:MAG: 50S ribosomal protein L17 [Dysgonamonadaceae bacterium]|jgi:large subunit ribosomal protein L17|nr:50S ribosomal protein L17 [Dysgonamonadaceae bacterium]